jgi:orotidine-5'-phosphate decarboxylase
LEPKERIIFALDVADTNEAMGLVEQLADYVGCFKIGLQRIFSMFRTGDGPAFFNFMKEKKAGIFIDSKLDDIPNTVKAAAEEIVALIPHPKFFNIHASAGVKAMADVVDVAKKAGGLPANEAVSDLSKAASAAKVRVLAVTVLTSLDEDEAHHIYGNPSKTKVLELARDALTAKVDGIICSAQELKLLRSKKELNNLLMVTPGIRPQWAAPGDQKRITTPTDAIMDGADYLVIGRPIREPSAEIQFPQKAAINISAEIAEALEKKAEKEKKEK